MVFDFSRVIMVREQKFTKSRLREAHSIAYCEDARRSVHTAIQEITDYAEEIQYLEIRLISRLMERRVTVHDIYAIEAELKSAEAKAKALSNKLASLRKQLDELERQLSELRKDRIAIQRKLHKIKELNKHINQLCFRSIMSAEDEEINEFAELIAGRRLL